MGALEVTGEVWEWRGPAPYHFVSVPPALCDDVRDAAEVVIQHQQGSTSLLQRRLNVGYGRGFSVLEVLDAVDAATGMQVPRVQEPRRAGDVTALISDPSRIRATTAWTPRYDDLETIVTHALAWERKLADMRRNA